MCCSPGQMNWTSQAEFNMSCTSIGESLSAQASSKEQDCFPWYQDHSFSDLFFKTVLLQHAISNPLHVWEDEGWSPFPSPRVTQPYTQKPLVLYQLETVPVPILDRNNEAQSCTYLQVRKPYIALNSETYISLRHQELRSCKRNDREFYCEELFMVKHKSSYSCESAIYF